MILYDFVRLCVICMISYDFVQLCVILYDFCEILYYGFVCMILIQISTRWPVANKDKQSTTTTETHRIQYYTSQTRKSDKRPCGRFDANFCKCTASENWSIVNEILQINFMQIAAVGTPPKKKSRHMDDF